MRLLLDSHIILWGLREPQRLSAQMRNLISNRDNEIYISSASLWELTIKEAKGLLTLPPDFDAETALLGTPLPVTWQHARQVGALPPLHKDPFDRLLLAQCQCESLTLITRDRALERYGVPVIAS